jgi:hypothetical protein
MWFFMITCYVLSALTFILLFVNGLQGYFDFAILKAPHATFALLTIILYYFTETLVIFFFVGVGVSIRDFVIERKLNSDYHKRSIAIKRKVYPPLLLNMLLVAVLFISGGAVDTRRWPGWVHGGLFYICLAHFIYAFWIQHRSFRETTRIVMDMSGISYNV